MTMPAAKKIQNCYRYIQSHNREVSQYLTFELVLSWFGILKRTIWANYVLRSQQPRKYKIVTGTGKMFLKLLKETFLDQSMASEQPLKIVQRLMPHPVVSAVKSCIK